MTVPSVPGPGLVPVRRRPPRSTARGSCCAFCCCSPSPRRKESTPDQCTSTAADPYAGRGHLSLPPGPPRAARHRPTAGPKHGATGGRTLLSTGDPCPLRGRFPAQGGEEIRRGRQGRPVGGDRPRTAPAGAGTPLARAGLRGGAEGLPGAVTRPRRPRPCPGYIRGGAHAVGLFRHGFAAGAVQVRRWRAGQAGPGEGAGAGRPGSAGRWGLVRAEPGRCREAAPERSGRRRWRRRAGRRRWRGRGVAVRARAGEVVAPRLP